MRTLKKSLCLVLALVFVLGLCTIGSNAATYAKYTDIDKVSYDEAVEVLTGLGVIEGYPDGAFNPTANVTRAEAAAMITRMMLGREDADKLPVGDVKFTDVPETNWAAKYIAFCANKGIIVGMGDGTFRPAENVTGTQMATMLLRALGYGVIGEYEGKGWDINAVADALYYKVFEDSKVTDFNQPATREENALYCWNTMRLEMVGYDVDLNYYDGKGTTFAGQAFNLRWTRPWQSPQVLSNQATGDPYTKVRYWEYEEVYNKETEKYENQYVDYEINLNIETGLDLIGHDVTVYYVGESKRDTENHCYYYEAYLVKDESTVIAPFSGFSSLDDLYRALKAANDKNLDRYFYNIPKWVNYDYESGLHVAPITDFDNMFGKKYKTVSDLKGQKSSMDNLAWMLVGGNWILDRDGNILCVISSSYQVGQVVNIDNDHDEVEVDVWTKDSYITEDKDDDTARKWYPKDFYFVSKNADGEEEVLITRDTDGNWDIAFSAPSGWDTVDTSDFVSETIEFEKNGVKQIYDDIAKEDYVQVQRVGKLIYLSPTETVTEEITECAESMGSWTFNGTYGKDSSGFGIPVEDWDDPADVGVGDVVKFYIIKGAFSTTYFALSIVEKANSAGTVYLNFATVLKEHSDWSLDDVIKVQCITEEGEEVAYKMTAEAFAKVGELSEDGLEVVSLKKGAYKASLRKKGFVVLTVPAEEVEFSKKEGRNSYLKGTYDYYYITDDTKVIYFTGEADTLSITVGSKLANKGYNYQVYAVSKKSGGSWKLTTVWVNQEAPVMTDKVMYLAKSSKYSFGNDRVGYDEDGTYYTVYIDGKKVEKAHLVGEDEIYIPDYEMDAAFHTTWFETLSESIWSGFYYYDYDDESNTYTITPVDPVTYNEMFNFYFPSQEKSLSVTLDSKSVKKSGDTYRLYTDYTDGVELVADIVDVSGGTTKGTKKDSAINSAARLYELLRNGYTVDITYMFTKVEGDSVPVGIIYVTGISDGTARN